MEEVGEAGLWGFFESISHIEAIPHFDSISEFFARMESCLGTSVSNIFWPRSVFIDKNIKKSCFC